MTPISIFSGGLWIIQIAFIIGLFLGARAFYKQMTGGSKWYSKASGKWFYSDEPPKFYQCWGFWVTVGMIAGIIWFLTSVISEA